MSQCAFNNDGHPELNDPELNCPRTCVHGIHCTYTGPGKTGCNFVHPGEEGTGRRLFPARVDEKTGQQQDACVRLVGSPGFYERRRLKMSWPQWCALPKNAHLRSEPRRGQEEPVPSPPAAPAPKKKAAAVAQMPPPPRAAPLAQWPQAQAKPPLSVLLLQARIHLESSSALAAHYEDIVAKGTDPTSFLGRCAQQQAPMHRTLATRAATHLRDLFGNELFARAGAFLDEVRADMVAAEQWSNEITAGRITGMLLEGLDHDELTQLLEDHQAFIEKMADASAILKQSGDAKLASASAPLSAPSSPPAEAEAEAEAEETPVA